MRIRAAAVFTLAPYRVEHMLHLLDHLGFGVGIFGIDAAREELQDARLGISGIWAAARRSQQKLHAAPPGIEQFNEEAVRRGVYLLSGVSIHRDVRSWDKPSDHVPLVIELDL